MYIQCGEQMINNNSERMPKKRVAFKATNADFLEQEGLLDEDDDSEDEIYDISKYKQKRMQFTRRHLLIVFVVMAICLTAIGLGIGLGLKGMAESDQYQDPTVHPLPSPSQLGVFSLGAISSDAVPCTDIGRDVMAMNGSAIDIAVATQICVGVSNAHSAGIGGGFVMTYYQKKTGTAHVLVARERAPIAANSTMYKGLPKSASTRGPLAIAVPGELAGLWSAHKKFGSLEWKTLFEPTIKLCEDGVKVSAHQARALKMCKNLILESEQMKAIYINPDTGDVWKENDSIKYPTLAKTLRKISEEGADVLYNGEIGKKLVQDIQEEGGIITMEDLNKYNASWMDPVKVKFNNKLTMYSSPAPASGSILGLILNMLDNYNFTQKEFDTEEQVILTYHRITEAFKFAYAQRTKLGDNEFENITQLTKDLSSEQTASDYWKQISDKQTHSHIEYYGAKNDFTEDHGTAHFSVISPDGDAVSLTSTVNLYFGSFVRSKQTGILLNDQMDDFSKPNEENSFGLPPSPTNFIAPRKRPMSSMSPAVFVNDTGDVRLVLGAAGGSKITSAVALVALRNIWFGKDIKTAVDERRIHHQLIPMKLSYENGFLKQYVDGLKKYGHTLERFNIGGSVICAVARENDGRFYANSDFRKGGNVAGID